MSGLGKGIVASSVAKLLQLTGLNVTCTKIDPYVNYDAGTMNPTAHGEVFVTEDGGECDMDMGNYERFLNAPMTKWHNITTGRIYSDVIKAEREGKYLGQCVQIIPHVTDVIKKSLKKATEIEASKPSSTPEIKAEFCPNCGISLRGSTARFCEGCGYDLEKE